MADPLLELLTPHLNTETSTSTSYLKANRNPIHAVATEYLAHLTTLNLSALSTTEPQLLAQTSTSNLRSLQALSSRSHKSVISAFDSLSKLREHLPSLTSSASSLRDGVPELDEKALSFSQKYSKANSENAVLDRRKKAMLLSRNVDRLSDILELPTLLATAIASSSSTATGSSASALTGVNYSQSLDLFAHIKRLQILHPDSLLVRSVLVDAEGVMKDMTSNLITSLRGQNIRLAAAIRTIGWLRRVAPDLAPPSPSPSARSTEGSTYPLPRDSALQISEGSFGYLFLTCRLYNLLHMLEALAPLRDLADQETHDRLDKQNGSTASSNLTQNSSAQRKPSLYGHSAFTGQQTERYLKRYLEIFREQSFATISMYKNIFPAESENTSNMSNTSPKHVKHPSTASSIPLSAEAIPIITLPTSLATFPAHIISLLTETLRQYLPNLVDSSARDSLLMQVLYAAGSLGRLGADFSLMIVSLLDDEDDDDEDEVRESEGESEVTQQRTEGDQHPISDARLIDEQSADEAAAAAVTTESGAEAKAESVGGKEDDAAALSTLRSTKTSEASASTQTRNPKNPPPPTPEWICILQKHRLQSSRLEALSASNS